MSSTYSSNLRIELIGSGDQAGAWGATTDSNLAYILDTAVAGYQAVPITSTSQALTYVNGPSSTANLNQSVYAMLKFTGATAATSVYIPPASKQYIVYNNSGYTITVYNSTVIGNTTAAGTGIALPTGSIMTVWSDATNVYSQNTHLISPTIASPTLTGNPVAPTPSAGDNDTSIATTAFVQAALGVVFPVGSIYTSTVSTNPGTSFGFGTWAAFGAGRVLMGSGNASYLAGTTGGSADAVVVSHTHTASSSSTFTGTAGVTGAMNSNQTHSHTYVGPTTQSNSDAGGSPDYVAITTRTTDATNIDHTHNFTPAGTVATTTTNTSTGVSATGANLQPYIVVYMWERTA